MLHSQARAAVPTPGEHCARPRATPSLQQQLQQQARSRFHGSSTLYLSGGNRLQAAVQAAPRAGSRRAQAR
jgi:hypothetical protein